MPRPFPPVLPLTADHAVVGDFIADLDAADAFQTALEPERWTLSVLRARQDGTLTRSQACLLQDIVLETLRLSGRDQAWSILAVTEVLPSVVIDGLDANTLNWLIRHLAALRRNVFGLIIRTQRDLLNAITTRKAQLTASVGRRGDPYLPLLDRAGDRLLPFLR